MTTIFHLTSSMNSPTPARRVDDGSLEDLMSNLLLSGEIDYTSVFAARIYVILQDPEIDSITWRKETVAESVTVTRQASRINHSNPSSPSPRRPSSVYPRSAARTPAKGTPQSSPAKACSRDKPARHQCLPLQQEPTPRPSQRNKVVAPLRTFVAPSAPAPEELKPPAVGEKPDGYYVITVGQEVGIFFHW